MLNRGDCKLKPRHAGANRHPAGFSGFRPPLECRALDSGFGQIAPVRAGGFYGWPYSYFGQNGALLVADDVGNIIWRVSAAAR